MCVCLGGLKEADAAIVGVAHQFGELLLAQRYCTWPLLLPVPKARRVTLYWIGPA